jgi:hypothetical protein
MIRLIAVAGFALAVATSAQAMTEQDGVTKVVFGCGPGMTRINGVCVARSTMRQARRCARWNGGVCARWY